MHEPGFPIRILSGIIFTIALSACSAQSTPTPISFPTVTRPADVPTLQAALPTGIPSPLPSSFGSIVVAGIGQPSHAITSLPQFISDGIYDSLLEIDPTNGALKSGLADAWHVSDDSRVISFHLRPDVQWHDGQILSAQDVVFTIKTFSDPALRLAPPADLSHVTDVASTDDQSVTVSLDSAYCAALTYLGTLKILPKHILEGKPLSELTPDEFIGSGPLVLKQWNTDALVFSRNASYWKGPPLITNWTYKIFPSSEDAEVALAAGHVDVAALNSRPPISLPKLLVRASNEFYGLALNGEIKTLTDVRVRQAIALALDRASIARSFFSSDAQFLQTSVLSGFWAAPPDAGEPSYDPARARQLLSDAGWSTVNAAGIREKDGQSLRFTLWAEADDTTMESIALAIREQLAQVGVQAIVQLDDHDDLLTRLFLHEFDLGLGRWNIPVDPDQHWFWQSDENAKGKGFNITSYSNPLADDSLKQGNSAANCDSNVRRTAYLSLFRTLAQDVPQVFLFAPPSYMAVSAHASGFSPSPFAGDYWNLNKWQVSQ